MTDLPNYADLDPKIHDKHQRIFSDIEIRQMQIDAAGREFVASMPDWVNWYLLAVKGGSEEAVAKDLDAHGIEAWVPKMIERKKCMRRGKGTKRGIIETKVLIFLGFVLVRIVPSSYAWHGLMGFDHVLGLVAPECESWGPMSDAQRLPGYMSLRFIERVRHMETAEFIDLSTGQGWFKVNEEVRIDGGPFAGLLGVVSKKPAPEYMIWVDVMIFGRGTKTLFELDQIKKKA